MTIPGLYIVAECAQGYASTSTQASIDLALHLTRCAKSANANAVKFQLVLADELATPDYKYHKLFRSLELGHQGWLQVSQLASEISIDLIFDIFGPASLELAASLGCSAVKIHPTDFSNKSLLGLVSQSQSIRHVIAGCGGASLEEIKESVTALRSVELLTLLHGFQGYPTTLQDNCLSRLATFASFLDELHPNARLGFADHADPTSSDSTHLPAVSLGFGVNFLEKHLTLSRCLKLEDYESANSPDEFAEFVSILNRCYSSLSTHLSSSDTFRLPASESNYRSIVTRHLVASRDLPAGHLITHGDFLLKRSPLSSAFTSADQLIGRVLRDPLLFNTPFTPENTSNVSS